MINYTFLTPYTDGPRVNILAENDTAAWLLLADKIAALYAEGVWLPYPNAINWRLVRS